MKIINQSTDELVLKEGSATGIAIGVVLVAAGGFGGYQFHASSPYAIWIALAVVVIGLAAILFSSSITVNANKTSGQILYQKKQLIGAKDSTFSFAPIISAGRQAGGRVCAPPRRRKSSAKRLGWGVRLEES
jgi:hypothetical protein